MLRVSTFEVVQARLLLLLVSLFSQFMIPSMGVLSLILRLPPVVIDCLFLAICIFWVNATFALIDDILVNTFMAREVNQHQERIT